MSGRLRMFCALLTMLLLTIPLAAQTTTGAINGRVTDTSDAVIPGVQVTLSSPVLQAVREVTTDESGSYRFILLPAGTYTVKYELPGFKTVIREGIILQGSRTVTLPIALEVATVAETVTVTGESPVVDVQNATVGVAFNNTMLRDLPNQRDVWAVLGQTPGITMTRFDVGGSTMGTQTGYRGYGISGQQWITVDGVATTEGTSGAGMYYDYGAFSEITVQAAANSAEVAVPGVYTNTVMKTGGNQFHGLVFLDWEDGSFQGDNITDTLKAQGFAQPDKFTRYNDFTFNAGGPIKKDKFWWFTSLKYQFSGLTTQLLFNDGITSGAPFTTTLTGLSGKVNYQLTPGSQLVWSHQRTTKHQPYRNGQGANAKNYIQSSTQNQDGPYFTNKFQYTSVLNSRMTLDSAWQWYYLFDPRFSHVQETPWSDSQTGIVRGAFGAESNTYRNRHQMYVNLNYMKSGMAGNHEFKTGFGEIYENNGGKTDCEYNTPALSAVRCVTLTYSSGQPNTAIIRNGPLKDRSRNELLNTYFFIQDKWQLGRKLTLNLGMRFDRYHSWYPEQTNPGDGPWASATYFPTSRFKTPYPRQDMPIQMSLVPRIAVVYDLFGNTKTALKGSFGRYGENTGTFASSINPQAVHNNTYNLCNASRTTNCATLPVTLANIAAILPTSTTANAVFPTVNADLSNPYTDEYTAGIEQELVRDLGVSVLFVRKVGFNQRVTQNLTYLTSEYAPVTGIDLGPDGLLGSTDDKRLTIFERIPATRGTNNFITNIAGGDNHSTIEFTLTKRFSNKWQLMAGYDYTKSNEAGSTSQDPNTLTFQNGHFKSWTYKALGIYELPKGIQLSGTYNAQKGQPYSRSQQFSGALRNILDAAGNVRGDLRQGTGAITIENNGYYLPATQLINLRAEKKFRITENQSLDAMFDIYNIFNWNTVTGRDAVTARITVNNVQIPRFGVANGILPPVIFKLGARYNF